ncbi:GntR family transcriptional regulator [Acinetobacter baumannii]
MLDETAFKNFKLPRYEKVRWELQKLLIQSKWTVEEPIPSEQELAQMYSVSVGTVRKAVEGLVEDGLLVKQQGKGTFLKQPNFENSLIRFFRLRNKKGEFIQPQGQIKKVEVCDAIPEVNAELGLGHTEKLLYIERVRKHEDVVVLSERIWLPECLFKNLEEIPIAEFGNLLYPFYYQHCGQFISSATERLTFEKNIKDSYLNNHLEDPLVKVCRIAKNLEGVAVEYRESYGLADNFHYEITIN